ncbi:N-6 DNA methylase, partial [bacterium]|nr:N-6 DNA methylase [bacterium]
PFKWCKWVIAKYHLLQAWRDGAVVFDPTAGTGNFLQALVASAVDNGVEVTDSMIRRLYGVEVEMRFVQQFLSGMKLRYGITFPSENFISADYLFWRGTIRADIVIGNPPWMNFTELPELYKEKLKPLFRKYGLVGATRPIILGNSRVDIAALIISRCIQEHLAEGGKALFFMPLSLLLNDGAHEQFRTYEVNQVDFRICQVFDFGREKIFENVSTSYCFCAFERNKKQRFPVPYYVRAKENTWERYSALPLRDSTDSWTIHAHYSEHTGRSPIPRISVPKSSKPRQGINTCGANRVYIFDRIEEEEPHTLILANQHTRGVRLPKQLVFPLISHEQFQNSESSASRFIFVPPDPTTGRPLHQDDLQRMPDAWNYLLSMKDLLTRRKGVMINSWIGRAFWWALLGVGRYSFAPYKVVWEAYGRSTFEPRIFSSCEFGLWQPNNALQAFMPFQERPQAERIASRLRDSGIQFWLESHRTGGSCNWAQPGRIGKFLCFDEAKGTKRQGRQFELLPRGH